MWMELLQIFRSGDPLEASGRDFLKMLALGHEMARIVEPHLFEHALSLEDRARIYDLDIAVNKLERSIRKRLVSHLSLQKSQAAYCLLLFSLVKDAERIGDYIKNVAEIASLGGTDVPPGVIRDELTELTGIAMRLFEATPQIVASQDRERAGELIQSGRSAGKRCDNLVNEIARSDHPAGAVTSMVLLARFYKRIGAHLVNILSSVVMPVHKVDYYDEREMTKTP